MSKAYEKSTNTAINTLVLMILFIIFPLLIPFTIVICFLLYPLKISNTRYLFAGGSFVVVLVLIISMLLSDTFLASQLITIKGGIINLIHLKFMTNIINIIKYDMNNYIFMLLISLEIGLYFKYTITSKTKKKRAGVHTMEKELDIVTKENKVSYKLNDGVFIGKSNENKPVFVNPSHSFITGTTGTGKTVLISNYIKYCAEKNLPCMLVDGKGDTGKGSIKEIAEALCERMNKKLYLIDMNDIEYSAKYNPFSSENETVLKDMLVNLTDWTEEHYKVNFERYIQRLIKLLHLKYDKLDFHEITSYINTDKFQDLSTELVKENLITKEEHLANLELIKTSGKIAEDAGARLTSLNEGEIGKLFDTSGTDIFQALKENAMIVFILNPLLYPEASKAFGRLVLIDAKQAVAKLYTHKLERVYFIFDEVNVYASETLLDLLNKCRSANVSCVLSMQSLSDIEAVGESFKNQVMENCNNFIIMRQNTFKSAEECSKIIGTQETMKMTYKVDGEGDSTGKGSARRVREFIIHPDTIKNLKMGEAIFLSKDYNFCTNLNVNNPIGKGE